MLIDITLNNIYKILEFANHKDITQKDIYDDLRVSDSRTSMYCTFLVKNKVLEVYKKRVEGKLIRFYKITSKGVILLNKLTKYNGLYTSIIGDINSDMDIFSKTKINNKKRDKR